MLKSSFYFSLLLCHVTKQTCALNFRYFVEHLRWNEPIVFTAGDYIFLAINIISTADYAPYIILSHRVNGMELE